MEELTKETSKDIVKKLSTGDRKADHVTVTDKEGTFGAVVIGKSFILKAKAIAKSALFLPTKYTIMNIFEA